MKPLLRGALLASGPLNVMGAALFAPPSVTLRAAFGVPEAPAFYLWTLSLWVLAFGVAYAHAGWRGRADASLLALGAVGKVVFVVLMLWMAWRAEVPVTTALASLSDLVLAIIFGQAWWRLVAATDRVSTR